MLRVITIIAAVAFLVLPPIAGAPIDGTLTTPLLEANGATTSSGDLGILRLRHDTSTTPLAAPDFRLQASRLIIENDHADYYVQGNRYIASPETETLYDNGPATLSGTTNRASHRLWITPLDGSPVPTVEIHASNAEVSPPRLDELVLVPHVKPDRGNTVTDTQHYAAWTGSTGVEATVRGDFLLVAWEWDARLDAPSGSQSIPSGVQGPAAEQQAGSADEVWVTAYDATLTIPLRPDTYELYLDGPRILANGTVHLRNAVGTLAGFDHPIQGHLELNGELDVAVTANGEGQRLETVIAGDVEKASLAGRPLILSAPAPASGSQDEGAWMLIAVALLALGGVYAMPSAWYAATHGAYGQMHPVQATGWGQRRAVGYWSLAVRLYTIRLRWLAMWLARLSLRNWSTFARPHLTLGDYELRRGRIVDAQDHYSAALEYVRDRGSRAIPMSGIVRCELQRGDVQAALVWLRRMERINTPAAREVAADPAWGSSLPPLVRSLRHRRLTP